MLYRFLDCQLDERTGELRKGAARVALEPKVLRLLLHLVRNGGRVVPRGELEAAVWASGTPSDAAVSQAVSRARRAIGDRDSRPAAIRAQHGRGYCFTPHVSVAMADGAAGGKTDAPSGRAAAAGPLVGRRAQLARLERQLDKLFEGQGGFVLLSGAAGIGKTRLATEIGRRAGSRGALVVHAAAGVRSGCPPFWTWVQVIREIAGAYRDGLGELLGAGLDDLAEIVPSLRADRPDTGDGGLRLPENAHVRLVESLIDALQVIASERPVVIVADDLHWSDPSSLMVLGLLARELLAEPIFVLGTCRPDVPMWWERFGAAADDLARSGYCVRIELEGLNVDQVGELVEAWKGRPIDREVLETLFDRTAGSPFLLTEIVHEAARVGVALEEAVTSGFIPASVRSLVAERLRAVDDEVRRFLEGAAVFGVRFHPADVVALCEADIEWATVAIERAQAVRLILQRGRQCEFLHGLMRDVIYEAIPEFQRRLLHRTAASMDMATSQSGSPDRV